MTLVERFLSGDERALARVISEVEAGTPRGGALLRRLRAEGEGREVRLIGVTGAPGSGKSTLVDRMVEVARRAGRRVGVVAVDPSSPFSGGAILGDRIRMTRWHDDRGVFIRSMAARGHLGGLAAASRQVVSLFAAFGLDEVLIETVGVGQSEVEIAGAADTTVVVLTPGQGDGVQAVKAGVMEIADVFVVNKADHEGASRVVREVRAMLELVPRAPDAWTAPVLETIASDGHGVDALVEALERHATHLRHAGVLQAKRRERARGEVLAVLGGAVRRALARLGPDAIDDVAAGRLSPEAVAERVLRSLAAATADEDDRVLAFDPVGDGNA